MNFANFNNIAKRDYYDAPNDIWCIADLETEKFAEVAEASEEYIQGQFVYGKWTVYFIVAIIFLAVLKNIFFKLHDQYFATKPASVGPSVLFQLTALNRYISYRKLPTRFFSAIYIPRSLGVTIITCSCALFTLIICFAQRPWYLGCTYYASPPVAIRSDIIATALVPFIFILAGKSNIISSITGIDYARMNVYHQGAGILCMVFSWVHAIPYYYQGSRENYLAEENKGFYYISGIPPLIFVTLLVGFSLPSIRKRYYETFVYCHWLFAIGFYIGLFYHAISNSGGCLKYMIAAIVISFAQMLYRGLRKGYFSPRSFFRPEMATIKHIKSPYGDNDCLEMTAVTRTRWSIMQHVFVRYLDNPVEIVQSHPFSILSSSDDGKLKILIRPKNGMTKRLLEQAKASGTGVVEKKVQFDGPYGGLPRKLSAFDCIFLVASGTGISAVFPALQETLKFDRKVVVRLDWCIRTKDSMFWIQKELEDVLLKASKKTNLQLTVNVHITNGSSESEMVELEQDYKKGYRDETERESDSADAQSLDIYEHINVLNSRLDIPKVIRDEYILGYRNIVIVSGSASMIYETGNCVASLQRVVFWDNTVQEVFLHSEAFDW